MIYANITDGNGLEICKLQIPTEITEIKYSQYIEYSIYNEEIYKWVEKKKVSGEPYVGEHILKVSEAVSKILGVDYKVIANTKLKNHDWIFDAWFMFERMFADYIPEQNGGEFIVGETFYRIPSTNKSIVSGNIYAQDLTFQQIEECTQCERILFDSIKAIESNKHIVKNGKTLSEIDAKIQAIYVQTVRKIALIVSDPKDIPTNSEFEKWIDEKSLKLKDISAVDALNTIFFLMNISKESGLLIELGGILNRYLQENTPMKMEKLMLQE